MSYSRMANATLPSPQLRFTSEFEMESGGSTALLPPGKAVLYMDVLMSRSHGRLGATRSYTTVRNLS